MGRSNFGFQIDCRGNTLRRGITPLNAFNLTNFLLFVPGNGTTTTLGANSTAFGQLATNSAYRDLSNTNDPGGRVIWGEPVRLLGADRSIPQQRR